MICDIVICVWNQKEITQECIESIHKNTHFPYRLVLIDNASDEATKKYLESLKDDLRFKVILIRNEKNLGNTKAVNQGLRATDAPFVCNLDNDTYVTEGWLNEMITTAQSDPKIGMVTSAGRGGQPPSSDAVKDIEKKAREVAQRRGQVMEMATIDCYCALIKRELINTIGVWDEIYSPGYFDDTDYCRRATNAGFRIAGALGSYVYHREGGSFKKNTQKEELFKRNQKVYLQRYGASKRILYIIDQIGEDKKEEITQQIYQNAKNANWVWFFRKKGSPDLKLKVHSHIRTFQFSQQIFYIKSLGRTLFKKKKFDEIYTTHAGLKSVLDCFPRIHNAKVYLIN